MNYPRQFCELSNRGKTFIDYYENGNPVKYCYGYYDKKNDEPLECCKKCLDFFQGEYHEKEIERRMNDSKSIIYCKDCKWWKESDGTYKRGLGAESKCPMNTEIVYRGEGYCYMAEKQESEEEEW